MSVIETLIGAMQMNRTRTLGLLDKIERLPDPTSALAFRPGPGRAHIAWQLMHVGVSEELFATDRLMPTKPARFTDLIPRFKGGSTPDDVIPTPVEIRDVLSESRLNLLHTLRELSDSQLEWIPPAFAERRLTLLDVLHIIAWHEPHHQGQAHITLNVFLAKA